MPSRIVTGCVLTLLATPGWANDEWSQFRGPNSSGHAGIQPAVPVAFGPDHNVRWKCSIPRGVSSPCVRGNRIFVTSFESEKSELKVICIGRENGDIKWQATVPADKVERVHKTSNPANATIVADDQRIYAYFASSGIFCFDHDGNPVWDHRLPTARRFNGSGTSPILAANQVILNREDNREAYLLALNPETGQVLWKTPHDRGGTAHGEATPVIWNDQVVLHRQNEVAAFDLARGKRQWSVPMRTTAASTPVIQDNTLYVAAWNNFGEADLASTLPLFAERLQERDQDKDGMLSRSEMSWGLPWLNARRLTDNGLVATWP